MQLSAVLLARVVALFEIYDLNPRGTLFYPDLVAGLVDRFRFQKFPQKFEDLNEQSGINFFEGTWNGITVGRRSAIRR